ncbi:MAG TPA: tetraacyldisaccharide 4'-kinase [Vicinamibacteria bacterium]|nr:tetraacyldisaccharide 4'-kinase [Vicinamibacteria bacterium]
MKRALLPLSWLYGAGVAVRNFHYDRGFGVKRLPVPVVSVGNLTLGGSGKTLVAGAICRVLLARGEPVALLSRGYGRRSASPFVLVSDGERLRSSCEQAGDEPMELATDIPSLAVAVGPDRVLVGERLVRELGPHVLVLDDGFQHRRLHRDLDLVCFDASEERSSLRLVPAGRLREPLARLDRADAVVVTGGLAPHSLLPSKPVLRAFTRVVGLSRVDAAEELPADALHDEPVGVLCGVARPERIRSTVPARVVAFLAKRDHHWWRPEEVKAFSDDAKAQGAKALLTTRKDAVKLTDLPGLSLPLFAIRLECQISEEMELSRLLEKVRLSPR